jgi:hypothetical protein
MFEALPPPAGDNVHSAICIIVAAKNWGRKLFIVWSVEEKHRPRRAILLEHLPRLNDALVFYS